MVNAPGTIFVKRHQGPSGYHDEVFHDDEHVVRTLTKILDAASTSHRKLDPTEGLQDAQLDTGARLHIVHSDLARGGHVMVNIRKFTGLQYHSLAELVGLDMLTLQRRRVPQGVRPGPAVDRVRRTPTSEVPRWSRTPEHLPASHDQAALVRSGGVASRSEWPTVVWSLIDPQASRHSPGR